MKHFSGSGPTIHKPEDNSHKFDHANVDFALETKDDLHTEYQFDILLLLRTYGDINLDL